MFVQRQVSRAAQRFGAQARAQGQRRFASSGSDFVKERQHVKEHAAATTGEDPAFVVARGGSIRELTGKQSCGARSPFSMPSPSLPAPPDAWFS